MIFSYRLTQRGWHPQPIISAGIRKCRRKNLGMKTRFCNRVIQMVTDKKEKGKIVQIRMKASIPYVHANSNKSYDIRYLNACAVGSIQLKKPLGGPKGLIGPPCHGALAAGGRNDTD
jgi:hypothetical protein